MSLCLNCDSKNNFFLGNDGDCLGCSIENCGNCEDLSTCNECESGFSLDDDGKCVLDSIIFIIIGSISFVVVVLIVVGVIAYKRRFQLINSSSPETENKQKSLQS